MFSVDFAFRPGDRVETIFGELGVVKACMTEGSVRFCMVLTRNRQQWFDEEQLKPSDWKDGDSDPIRWPAKLPKEQNDSPAE